MLRGLARLLPQDAQLALDPYGERFSTPALDFVRRRAAGFLFPMFEPLIVGTQVRTHVIDRALSDFIRDGGDQVLLLGAGFDTRASRFAEGLAHATLFEVDHPSTQAVKRARIEAPANVRYLAWDFEAQPASELPNALAALGHDATRPTLTIWEGVTMYLTADAVDASTRAIARLSASGSPFVFTYIDAAALARPGLRERIAALLVRWLAEPLKFGFEPRALEPWLAERGFAMRHDASVPDAAAALLPARYHKLFTDRSLHVTFARRA